MLDSRIKDLLIERFGSPTKTQFASIPSILKGGNVLLIAPTGTGKTEAAVMPLLSKMINEKGGGVRFLYITPLRALNRDLLERFGYWGKKLGLNIGVRHGDTTPAERAKQLSHPPDLLITTPETLQILLVSPKMKEHLRAVKFVVVDEIHELAGSKRGTQLSLGLERLIELSGMKFQRIGLSATVGNPGVVAAFLGNDVEVIEVSLGRKPDISVEAPAPQKEDLELSHLLVVSPEASARMRRIREHIKKYNSLLIFVNTRSMAEQLSSRMLYLEGELGIGVHHSSLSKDARLLTEKDFKSGKLKSIICTSSLELGIDVGSVDAVIQYSSPRQVSRLIQRVGRSGHSIDRYPRGIIITAGGDDVLEAAVIAKEALAGLLEPVKVPEMSLDVLGHQIVGWLRVKREDSLDSIFSVFRRAYPFRNLTMEDIEYVSDFLSQEGLIGIEDRMLYARGPALKYYFENVSTIPDEKKFFVKDILNRKNVGMLDEAFVSEHLKPGTVFITRGRAWKVLEISGQDITVEETADITAAVPDWIGDEIPVPFRIAQGVNDLRARVIRGKEELDRAGLKGQEKYFIPSNETLFIETQENIAVIHTNFGSLINETLSKLLSTLIAAELGSSVRSRTDPYRIIIEFPFGPRVDLLIKHLKGTKPEEVEPLLEMTLSRTALFQWKLLHVARRFGLIGRDVASSEFSARRLMKGLEGTPVYRETLNELAFDKLDIPGAKKILDGLRNGTLKISEVGGKGISPVGMEGIERLYRIGELILPGKAMEEILSIMRRRLFEKKFKLVCTYCDHLWIKSISELPEKILCDKCGSPMVTATWLSDNEARGALKAGKQTAKYRELMRIASLVEAYGRKAVIALAARGVGPETATRILGRLHATEGEFLRDLLDAEKTYVRTRQFWAE